MNIAPVVIVDYDPNWPHQFTQEASRLREALGSVVAAIEHIGSTAVEGLSAKPIIDIMVGLHDLDAASSCIPRIEALGYTYVPTYEADIPDRRYFHQGPPSQRTHHLHVVETTGVFWERHLLFRDYLRSHPSVAEEYDRLKRSLAAQFGSNRKGYTDAKSAFIASIEQAARRERSVCDRRFVSDIASSQTAGPHDP